MFIQVAEFSNPTMEELSSVQEVAPVPRERVGALRVDYSFLLALLACTWIPMAFFILLAPPDPATGGLSGIKSIFLFLGTAHVPATLYFYTDREFSGIINAHRARFIYVPILLTVITGLLFVFLNPTGQVLVLLTYWGWQAFHYGRQNIGVYAFASIAQSGTAPHRAEKVAIDLGTIIGILGTFKILGGGAPAVLRGSFDWLYRFGAFAFIALAVFSLAVYITYIRRTTILKTLFFFTSVFFFLPVFLSSEINIAFLSYAIAHGLQYLVFMSVVSANSDNSEQRRLSYQGIVKLSIAVFVLGFAFWRVADLQQFQSVKSNPLLTGIANFLFGAVLGATMSHFVVDASAWKLSLAPQRAYIAKRFGFIFARKH